MISTRGRYALRVMIDIAENGSSGYVCLDDVAKRENISEKYLEGILASLTRAGLLQGLRGKGGGYRLTRAPQDYTILDILSVTEGSLAPVACLKGGETCERTAICHTLPLWQDFYKTIENFFRGKTLADLLGRKDDYTI